MSDKTIIGRLLVEMRHFYGAFILALLLYVPVTLMALAQPLLIGEAVEKAFKTKDLNLVTWWASLFFFAVVLHAFFEMCQLYTMRWAGLQMVYSLRQRLFAKIQQFSPAFFDQTPLGRILTRMTNDIESLSELFSSAAVSVIGDIFFLLGTLLMLFFIDFKLSLASLVMLPVLASGLWLMRQWMRRTFFEVRSLLSKLNSFLQEYLSGMQTVQLFAQVKRIHDQFNASNIEYMKANRRAILIDAGIYAFVDAMGTITIALVLWVGFQLRHDEMLSLGIMVTFVEALSRFFYPIRELANKYATFQSALVSGGRIFELLDTPTEENTAKSLARAKINKCISFQNVSFAYRPNATVLRDINFLIHKGEKVALVGHTGAGKSTVTKLITRFYEVTSGRILFDDTDIRQFDMTSLRSLFNIVPQEVFLFSGSLRDNLRYGKESATDEEILTALDLCQASYLLAKEGALDAQVGLRGHHFSLGERQLLALARALIANPEILILDEATASIDRKTERRLQIAIAQVLKNRTALIVAHRLSTIRECDRILVFNKGVLIEQGSHEFLMAQNGNYAKLVELQERESELRPF
jgi:ATP-binding cassette, subfamily B, multidrug efflux pump